MIDIREKIEKDADRFIPEIMLRLIHTASGNGLNAEEFTDIVRDGNFYEIRILEYINRTRPVKVDSLEDALQIFGVEYCCLAFMNILTLELSGKKETEEISNLTEQQLFTAVSSFVIAKKSKITFPHVAYISGLLTNVSYYYFSETFSDEFLLLMKKDKSVIKRMNYEWEKFGIDHAEISYLILSSAGVGQEIYTPVMHHHQKNFQENLGSGHIKDLSLAVYFGSLLTNLFYEDFNLASDFRKEIKNFMGLYSFQLEDIVDEIIETFKTEARSLGLTNLTFPGYFKLLSWYDTKLALVQSELELADRKIADINFQNIKFQKALEDNNKKLVGLALKDPLTGAYNRRYLDERLHEEFLKAKRYNQCFTLISADIDHFKLINDTYGHAFGDIVLIKLVQIIKSSIRKTDYIARTGGEEFIVVCHSSNELGGIIIAEKMRKIIENSSFRFEGKDVPVTMSFGVVNYFPEVKSVEELVRISDDRLYAAKNAGRNKVIYK